MRHIGIKKLIMGLIIMLGMAHLPCKEVQAAHTVQAVQSMQTTQTTQEAQSILNSAIDDEQVNYTEIQEVIDHVMEGNDTFSFESFVKELVSSGNAFSIENILATIKKGFVSEFNGNLSSLAKIIAIAIVAAIFTNFATVFMDNQVAETGFYITYILLLCTLVASFRTASLLVDSTVENTLDFMKVLIPTYFMTVAMSTGSVTSVLFYEFTLVLITLVNIILLKLVLPAINVYLIIMLTNNLSKDDKLSKFAETIATAVRWLLKTLIALVIGFNAIQALIAPFADQFKRSILVKAGSALPGIGNLLSGVTEMVLGAGMLLKNSIGVAGVVVLLLICMMPIIKLVVYYFLYKFGEAIVQPISDKRILNCIGACSEAISLLLQTLLVCAILFVVTLTIVTASTSIH